MNRISLNRAITDENGLVMDTVAGPFFMAYVLVESETLLEMAEDLKEKYMTMKGIKVLPYEAEKQDIER